MEVVNMMMRMRSWKHAVQGRSQAEAEEGTAFSDSGAGNQKF